jgi:protein-tyrosine phosphatase
LAADNTLYVHCRGGRERSATVATAVIAHAEQVSVDRALERAVERRPVFKPLPWQMTALRSWEAKT